jgi:hypothetical protein
MKQRQETIDSNVSHHYFIVDLIDEEAALEQDIR